VVTAVWIDPGNGAAGDMLLAALIDAGADLQGVRDGLALLPVERVSVTIEAVRRHGFRASYARVEAPETATHRGPADIAKLVTAAGLSVRVTAFALSVFERLAAAEARVHGIPLAEVHFHEVGALDAIADVVGCSLALDDLGLLAEGATRVVGPVAVGSGVGRTAHGRMPIPAPAVLELLASAGAPIAAHPAELELCTPTGAALLATVADSWGPAPSLRATAVGIGAGTRDPQTHPNMVRVLVGEAGSTERDWAVADLSQVEATIDDLDPRVWPDLLEALRAAGAADAWATPALMRKGRPGQVLTVLVDPDRVDLISRLIFTQTTTLGIRVRRVERRALRRDQVTVAVDGHRVAVKRAFLSGEPVTVQPEYDDALAASQALDMPVATILDRARAIATGFPPG
jgi:uncharacterized protein (TIGR00299 family) protein